MERKAQAQAARAAMSTALGAVMLFGAAAGAYAQDKTEITFSYLWGGAEGAALEQIIADFNASQDKIVVKGVSSPDMTKQLASMSSAKGAFDISDNFASNIASWSNQGILLPLDEFGLDTSDFPESIMKQLVVDGTLYSVPIATHNFQLVYNKKLLDEAGVTPPTSMAELADAIKKLTKVDAEGNVTQLGLGLTDISAGLKTLGYAHGGDWNRDGKPTPTDANFIKGVQFYYDNVVAPVTPAAYNKFVAGFGPYMSDATRSSRARSPWCSKASGAPSSIPKPVWTGAWCRCRVRPRNCSVRPGLTSRRSSSRPTRRTRKRLASS